MNYEKLDEDTKYLFREILACLNGFFGYSDVAAKELVDEYLAYFYSDYEEEFIHQQQAYRSAAVIHYTVKLKGPRSGLSNYLSNNLPVSGGEAVSFLLDFRRNSKVPKILGGDA